MKSSKLILALWLGASLWAQTSPQNKPANPPPAAKPGGVGAASPPKATAQPSNAQPSKAQTGNAQPGKAQPSNAQPGKKPAASVAQSAGGRSKWRKRSAQAHSAKLSGAKPKAGKGRRDPFVSPVVERLRAEPTCTGTGRQCLLVGEVTLRGIVHGPSGYIAVVANGEHTYFLRVNDPLADGAVERITNDAIVLRERSSDPTGRAVTREVTRKLGVAPAS